MNLVCQIILPLLRKTNVKFRFMLLYELYHKQVTAFIYDASHHPFIDFIAEITQGKQRKKVRLIKK